MNTSPPFDVAPAHRYFAATCFNGVWELLDRAERTPEDEIRMLAQAHASLWHWLERPDRTPRNLSVGYWQLSRVYAVLGNAAEAWRYGKLCLEQSGAEPPFFLGYAYEALARAEHLAGNSEAATQYLAKACEFAGQVEEVDEQRQLEQDLESIRSEIGA